MSIAKYSEIFYSEWFTNFNQLIRILHWPEIMVESIIGFMPPSGYCIRYEFVGEFLGTYIIFLKLKCFP
jgi:hypothetical protein